MDTNPITNLYEHYTQVVEDFVEFGKSSKDLRGATIALVDTLTAANLREDIIDLVLDLGLEDLATLQAIKDSLQAVMITRK